MKISIIAEGGGMRGAYSLGAIDSLYSHFGLKQVDYLTGSSSGIGTLAYYAAGQFYPGYYIWPLHLPNPKFMSIRNIFGGHPFVNVDYLIDCILKKRVPLKESAVKRSKMHLIVPLTNTVTGNVCYFDNRTHYNFFEVLRASMAMPFAYGKSVQIGLSRYIDGTLTNPLPTDVSCIKRSKKIIPGR